MNAIRQRLVSLRTRACDLQTTLRRWALYNESLPREMREALLARMTPVEETAFESDLELTKARLKPVSVQLVTVSKWYDFVLETIHEQLDRARGLMEQGRFVDCQGVLTDVESRLLAPNEETLGFVFRSFAQHTSHEYHQKLASIDSIIRDLWMPTVKLAHQRGAIAREGLSQTPLAYLTDGPDGTYTWREHERQAGSCGRRLPVTMLAVPRNLISQPWNLGVLAHEVARCLYHQLELTYEFAGRIATQSVMAGVSPRTAPMWASWHEAVFADVFSTLKLGPAYVSCMIELLGANPASCMSADPCGSAPPAYVRWHVMLQTLQLMQMPDPARELFNQIHLLCGELSQASRLGVPLLAQCVADARGIAGLVAFGPCQRLDGARIADVVSPLSAIEWQNAMKVKELLLAGDESCASDEHFTWAEPISKSPIASPVALVGLRCAFDLTAETEPARRLWVRFWCLMQYLTGNTEPTREQEDREYAPGDALLRTIARQPVTPIQPLVMPRPVTGSFAGACA